MVVHYLDDDVVVLRFCLNGARPCRASFDVIGWDNEKPLGVYFSVADDGRIVSLDIESASTRVCPTVLATTRPGVPSATTEVAVKYDKATDRARISIGQGEYGVARKVSFDYPGDEPRWGVWGELDDAGYLRALVVGEASSRLPLHLIETA
jgi:hypothetical protein